MEEPRGNTGPHMYEYRGNLHIHTKYSDGSGDIDAIARAAAGAGLDFIGINDHDNLRALDKGESGYRHGVLVIAGTEVNRSKNHYLAYGVKKVIGRNDENPQAVIDEVKAQGGFGIIAHPHEKGSRFIMGGKTYCWDRPDVTGFDGICIWNMLSQWRDACSTLAGAVYYGIMNPPASLIGPPGETLAWWDKCCLSRKVVAIGGSDAHAIRLGFGPLKLTLGSYDSAFKCINVRVLSPEPLGRTDSSAERDTRVILNCLRHGRCFISLDALGPAEGFRFTAEGDETRGHGSWHMGDTASPEDCKDILLRIKTPGGIPCRIRLIKDGRPFMEGIGQELICRRPEKGVYRAEADRLFRRGSSRHWIYSNPIWLGMF